MPLPEVTFVPELGEDPLPAPLDVPVTATVPDPTPLGAVADPEAVLPDVPEPPAFGPLLEHALMKASTMRTPRAHEGRCPIRICIRPQA